MTKTEGMDIDISLDNQETKSDTLHGIAQSKINKPAADWDSDDVEHVGKVVKHPLVSPDTVSKLYSHVFPKGDTATPGKEKAVNHEALEHIFESKKVSLADTEDFINRAGQDMDRDNGPALGYAAKHPGLTDEFKEQKTNEFVDDPEKEHRIPFKHRAQYLHSLLMDRPLPEPEEGRMTTQQINTNKKVKKIDNLVFGSLKSATHTKEEYDQSVRLLTSDAPYGYQGDYKDVVHDFIDGHQDLDKNHLESFASAYGDNGQILDAVIKHPNVDPALVAKTALSPKSYEGWSDPRSTALSSPKLPENVRQSMIEGYNPTQPDMIDKSPAITHMLTNEHLPSEDVTKIYEKTKDNHAAAIAALSHPNVNPSLIESHYANDAKKSAAFTNDILRLPKTTPSILRDIVGTNKNANAAIAALSHKNADMSVVETGLKRKMKAVQEAASLNPLVANKVLRDKLKNGNIAATDVLFDEKTNKAFGEITKDDINTINDQYKKNVNESTWSPSEYTDVKYWLATNENVPQEIQKQNRKDLIADYMKNSKASLESQDDPEHGSEVNKTLIALADNTGDADVKAAILERPWSVLDKLDYKNDNYDTAFLDKMEPKIAEFHANKQKVEGKETQRPYQAYLRPFVQNPNTSQELFDKITLSPEFLDNSELLNDGVNVWTNDKARTLFDTRYADADENERYEGFKKLADMNHPTANYAIVNSTSAPEDIWNKAFFEMPAKKRNDFVGQSAFFVHKMDEVNLNKALNGEFAFDSDNKSVKRQVQMNTIEQLDSSNPKHIEALKNYVTRVYGSNDPAGQEGHINKEHFVDNLATNFWKDDPQAADDVVKHALTADRYTGALMAYDHAYANTGYSDRKELPAKLQQQFAFDGNPAATYSRWDALLHKPVANHAQDELRGIAEAGGNLDFLANLPGDAENGYSIRLQSLRRGLLSENGIKGVLQQDPKMFTQALGGMNNFEKARATQAILGGDQIDKEAMHGVLENLDHTVILKPSRIGRSSAYAGKMSDEDWGKSLGLVDKIVDHSLNLAAQRQIQPSLVSDIANKITYDRGADDKLTIPQRKEIVSRVADRILNSNIESRLKSDIVSDMSDSIKDEEMMPTNLKEAVGKLAVESSNLETLVELKADGKSSKAINSALIKAIRNVNKLPASDVQQLAKLLNPYGDLSDANTNRILDGITARTESADGDDMNLVSDTLRDVAGVMTYDNAQLQSKALDHVLKVVNTHQNPYVVANATNAIMDKMGKMAPENQKTAFLGLPHELSEHANSDRGMALDVSTVNDPEILLGATSGWKFDKLLDSAVENAAGLNQNTVEVLTNRVIDHPEIHEARKLRFASSLSQGKTEAHQKAAINLFRSAGPTGAFKFLQNLESDYGITPNESVGVAAVHAVADLEATYNAKRSDVPAVDFTNISDTIFNLSTVAAVSGRTQKSDGTGTKMLRDAVSKSLGVISGIHAAMISKIDNHSDKLEDSQVQVYSEQIQSFMRDTVKSFKTMDHDTMIKALEAQSYGTDAINAYVANNRNLDEFQKSNLKTVVKENEAEATEFLHNWSKNSGLEDHQWHGAFQAQPRLKFMMDKFTDVSMSAIEAVDLDKMLNDSNPEAVDLFMDGFMKSPWTFRKEEASMILDKTMPKLLDKMTRDSSVASQVHRFVEASISLYPSHFNMDKLSSVVSNFTYPSHQTQLFIAAAVSGAGGNDAVKKAIELVRYDGNVNGNSINSLAKNAKLDKSMIEHLFREFGEGSKYTDKGRLAINLAQNKQLDHDSVRMLYGMTKDPETAEDDKNKILDPLVQHPAIDFDTYKGIYHMMQPRGGAHDYALFFPSTPFNKAFLNREHGGRLLRSLPPKIPEKVSGVDSGESKLPKTFEWSPSKNRLKEVMPLIPAEGIHWTDFKKANPNASNWHEIKNVFLSNKDDIARPEDFVRALDNYGGDYHLTFTRWEGAQRHAEKGHNKPNLVVQLNTGEHMENELKQDPKLFAFFQTIQKAANRSTTHQGAAIGGHPVTPFCASWVRVDTSNGKDGWIIEEFQSDFAATLSHQVEMISKQHPDGLTIEGQHFHADEMKAYAKKIEKIVGGWHEASSKGMEEFAKKQGVKNLYLHGEGVRAQLSGMDDRDAGNPIWMQHMYNRYPKNNGWDVCSYTDYPNYSDRFVKEAKQKGRNLACWKKEIK